MARKYGASDLGSEWVTVPRNFRGRKPTSSPTTLAYITAPERGLLKKYALMKTGKDQVGPEGIPSYDDSGFGDSSPQSRWRDPTLAKSNLDSLNRYNKRKKEGWTPEQKVGTPGGGASVYTIPGVSHTQVPQTKPKPSPKPSGYPRDIHPPLSTSKPKDKSTGGGGGKGQTDPCGGRCNGATQNCVGGRCVDKPGTGGDCGGKTCRSDQKCVNNKCVPIEGEDDACPPEKGRMYKGTCYTECKDTMGEEYTGTHPNCKLKSTGESVDGNGGGKGPSLNTILQPDQTPMLQTLTDEMDLRNMLGSVLNKNNPLFKQARTRALQAMAARGVVNSTMAEESVMSAIMNVAMPIATRVIDDFQRVMAANVNATNAFKAALNQAYYQELISRVDAANNWNLNSMAQSSANWRERFGAFTGAKDIEDKDAFERYMAMITGSTKSKDWTAPTFP